MLAWRIAKEKWALEKDCEGSRRDGGRWNPVGLGAMYAGGTLGICALEVFVHLAGMAPPPLKVVKIEFPDGDDVIYRPSPSVLPDGWWNTGSTAAAQAFGGAFLRERRFLAMAVPSVIVPEETNYVFNPEHPLYKEVRLSIVRDFEFDKRMFK